jgi:hypothetical protein
MSLEGFVFSQGGTQRYTPSSVTSTTILPAAPVAASWQKAGFTCNLDPTSRSGGKISLTQVEGEAQVLVPCVEQEAQGDRERLGQPQAHPLSLL